MNCQECGESLVQYVPYGDTQVQMNIGCDCEDGRYECYEVLADMNTQGTPGYDEFEQVPIQCILDCKTNIITWQTAPAWQDENFTKPIIADLNYMWGEYRDGLFKLIGKGFAMYDIDANLTV